MTSDEKRVLLAAAAAPLRWSWGGGWCRMDLPAPARVNRGALQLLRLGLLQTCPNDPLRPVERAGLTHEGLVQAKAIRHVLGRRRREILAAIDAAGELVRRERETTEAEFCEILASGGAPTETVTEWVAPCRTAPRVQPIEAVCSGSELQDLVDRGLAALLNGGTRAVLSGAGRWCALGDETASNGRLRPA